MYDDGPLTDLALLALVVAYGTDADLDPRETDALAEHLARFAEAVGAPPLSGSDVSRVMGAAASVYGRVWIGGVEAVVERLGTGLPEKARRQAYDVLCAVAEADGDVGMMEGTLLRHIALAWREEGGPPGEASGASPEAG